MPKIPQGMRKKGGVYEYRYSISGTRYSDYGSTVEECQEKRSQRILELQSGIVRNKKTVTELYEDYIATLSIKPATLRKIKYEYAKVKPFIGNKDIKAVTRKDILRIQKALQDVLSTGTINHLMATLKSIFGLAVIDHVLIFNPCDGIKMLTRTEPEAKDTYHRALTIEEQTEFFKAAKASYYYELFAFLVQTGMRIGEAGALTWKDVDFQNKEIRINKTVTRSGSGYCVGSPKTKSSNRTIPLTASESKILMQQRNKVVELYGYTERIFVPLENEEQFVQGSLANHALNSVLKRTDIDHFTCHAFRDTFATRFLEQGGNMNTLKTLLGHTSIKLTMDLYAHVLPDTKATEMESMQVII